MSSTSEITEQIAATDVNQPNVSRARASSWSLWTRQTVAIMRLEIKKKLFEPSRISALFDGGITTRLAVDARALSAADRRAGKLQRNEPGLCGDIRRSYPSDAHLFRLCVGFYEPISRRGG